jgi:hypothetical protein
MTPPDRRCRKAEIVDSRLSLVERQDTPPERYEDCEKFTVYLREKGEARLESLYHCP